MIKGWKDMAATLVERHGKYGASMVPEAGAVVPDIPGDLFDEHVEGVRLEVEGRHLRPKQVQKWMWENRATALGADCIWSVYDEESEKSYVGFGLLKKPQEV